ncbi:hypothetical protein HDU67_009908 [Dinochytrium kinnereticum]|nr:hypothetical protein HDU67_009908 [Dinochytrium kinnereticum]
MNMVQAGLEKKRIEFAKRMEECREKQEELRAKQKQIRDRVTKFEKFLKENDAKRQRANLKAQSEKRLREQKEQELALLFHTLGEEHVKSENTLRLIKSYQIYEKYLQSVVDILPPDYLDVNEPHINDILMRYKTLVETNEDLIQMLQSSQDTIEREATALTELIKEKNDLILVYNSKLGIQQKRLDKLKLESAYTEQKLEERDNTGKERMRLLGETKLAIHNIFERIMNHTRSTTLPPTKPAFLLNIIMNDPQPSNNNPRPSNAMSGNPMLTQIPQGLLGGGGLGGGGAHGANGSTRESDGSIRGLAEKLHMIQERLLDLQRWCIVASVSLFPSAEGIDDC